MRARINRLLRVSHWNPQAGRDLDWAGLGRAGAASPGDLEISQDVYSSDLPQFVPGGP